MITDHRPWSEDPLRAPLGAETMLSTGELDFLHWLGKSQYSGAGRVVELGSFLGGSTLALCHGLSQNPAWTQPLLAYDRFVMFNDQEGRYTHIAAPGESFLPAFRRNIRAFSDRVTTRPMSIPAPTPGVDHTEALYPEREPIEILFIDAAKTWPVHITILDVFGPHLIPGKSIVIQQDFKWATVFYLPLHMHQLRECFEPAFDIPDGASTAFRYLGNIDRHLGTLWQPTDFDIAGANAVWDAIDQYWGEHARGDLIHIMRLLRAQHLASLGDLDQALSVIESAIAAAIRDDASLALEAVRYASSGLRKNSDAMSNTERLIALEHTAAASIDALRSVRQGAAVRALLGRIDRAPNAPRPTAFLFGAGQIARRILALDKAKLPFKPLAVIDDHAPLEDIASVPVIRPSDLAPHAGADLLIIASDAHADALEQRARAIFPGDTPIVRFDRPAPVARHA